MGADAAHENPEVARRLSHIYGLHYTEIDMRLAKSPYVALLEKLGNPHKAIPPVIHVAGTNGKGSVIAFMQAIFEAAGYKVHAYTSPHLVRFNERIRLAGTLITDEALISLYDEVLAANAGAPITFFEFTTALAFLAMSRTKADITLLETGMGGRLDCTNVIECPACTVITKISYDHMEFLGNTLPQIAAEKAGIMKAGVPCIIAPQMDENATLPVFENAAKIIGAPLCVSGKNYSKTLGSGYPSPSLMGPHQLENAATAIAAIKHLKGFDISEEAIKTGLVTAIWPARMQPITQGRTAAMLPPGWELWFDAAHNDSGAQALAGQLALWRKNRPETPIHLVIGMAADKSPAAFFTPMAGLYDTLTLVDLNAARKPQSAQNLAQKPGTPPAALARDIPAAVAQLIEKNKKNAIICAAGSLYLYQTL